MELPSVAPLQRKPRATISVVSPEPRSRSLSRVAPATPRKPLRILDFDTESLAAGFDDPQWVPQHITCSAWSWVGEDKIHVRTCGYKGFFVDEIRARSMKALVDAIRQADIVRGHNLLKHDLPIINGECLRFKWEPLPAIRVQDSMRIVKTKGFKKGQDNLAMLLKLEAEKMAMNHQAWQDAYAEPGWPKVKLRCVSDVEQHKQLYEAMSDAGWLRAMTVWNPRGR